MSGTGKYLAFLVNFWPFKNKKNDNFVDRENVIMTGSSDGVVRMWSSDLVEVPAAPQKGRAASEEGFVVVADGGVDDPPAVGPAEHPAAAADGYAWRRQLVYRGKLTMHTAFERPDNVEPAAVTAVSVSKDHRSIYVGDSRGRVFSWMVASRPGKGRYRDIQQLQGIS